MPPVAQPRVRETTRRAARHLRLVAAGLFTAVAAWLSQGVTAFTHAAGDRIVMLPLEASAALLVLAPAGFVLLLARAGASLAPLGLLVFVLLPWIPGAAPPAFLLWSGPLTTLLWAAVALLMIGQWLRASAIAQRAGRTHAFARRPLLAPGAAAFAIYALSAWQVSPSVPGGDEPHYLVITQSLLSDGDLRIENNHRRGDYQAYHPGPLQPDFRRRGGDGQIYSIHAPGVSALVAPAFAIGGYPAVVVFLMALAAAGTALAWHLAFLGTGRTDAAWFGWAAVTLATTSIFHSFTVYPDGPGGVLVLTGVWALFRAGRERETGGASVRPWLLHGAALAALPWFHTRFALFAATLGAVILLRLARTPHAAAKAMAFLAVPAVSAVGWIGYFVAIYGTPDPSAPYAGEAGSFAFVPGGLTGLFFDQRFGLLAYAPVLAAAFAGLVLMAVRGTHRRLAIEMLFVLVPYLVTVTHFAMWWGGWSAPARFAAPVLPMLAVPAAICWMSMRDRVSRTSAMIALSWTIFASAVLVMADGGRLAYNAIREPAALWLPRINGVVDIAGGLPLWSRTADAPLFRDTAVWIAAIAAAWAVARWGVNRLAPTATVATALTVGLYVAAAMLALTGVWRFRGSEGIAVAPAQIEMLRHIARSSRSVAVDVGARRPVSRDNIPGRLRIELTRASSRDDRPLFAIAALPAGEYRVTPIATDLRGWVMLGVGRDQFALRTEPLPAAADGLELRLGTNVRELVMRGDEDARQVVGGLRLEPLALVPQARRPTDAFARRAVLYGQATVFFLDDGSFAEPEAFWVAGARSTSIVVQPNDPAAAVDLHLRNAPVENRLVVESGKWREEVPLGPGEERRLRVPLEPTRDATLVHLSSAAGFRPSAVEPNSRDDRYLGVWVRVLR